MALKSPFPKENLEVLLDRQIDTRFSARENSFEGIADNIHAMAMMKKGNYMAFFPSYKYMNNVYEVFCGKYGTETDTFLQTPSMEDAERETVMASFRSEREKSYVAFMVLGGVFAEGIDLKGEALIGAAVVGVGYPQVSFERDLIRVYFEKEGLGYEYAYIYPGMNRVLQAGGRVIRTEEDKGTILLMDLRYSWNSFKSLLPEHWLPLSEWKRQNHL
jgi:Rad3-related DNA helicase